MDERKVANEVTIFPGREKQPSLQLVPNIRPFAFLIEEATNEDGKIVTSFGFNF